MVSLYTAAQLAALAYHPASPMLDGWKQLSRITLRRSLDDQFMSAVFRGDVAGSDFGFVATNGAETVAAFRGTKLTHAEEVLADLDCLVRRGMEAGFEHVYRCLAPIPLATIAIGHSLGGSLALIYSRHSGSPVVTFGAPKTFHHEEPDVAERTKRVENFFDPIPAYPVFGYASCGERVEIRSSGLDRHSIANYCEGLATDTPPQSGGADGSACRPSLP